MGAAAAQAFAFGAFAGGGEREFIGQFQRAGQKAGGQNRLQRAHGGVHGTETDGEIGAERRQRNQFQRGFGDDAEQAFGADKEPVEIEAGLVFVRASAEADDGAVGQNDFEAEDVIAGDAVFQAARAAGVGGDVAADEIVRAAGGVGRIKQAALLDRGPEDVCVLTPGWTTATKSAALISRMRFMRSSESTMPPRTGTQPPT